MYENIIILAKVSEKNKFGWINRYKPQINWLAMTTNYFTFKLLITYISAVLYLMPSLLSACISYWTNYQGAHVMPL